MNELAIRLGRDEKDIPRVAAFDEAAGEAETVDEAGAAEIEVERAGGRRYAEPLLHQARGRRKKVVGTLRAEEEEVDRRRIDGVVLEKTACAFDAEVRRADFRGGDAPAHDSGLARDLLDRPFRETGVQLLVGQLTRRKVVTDRLDRGRHGRH